MGLRQTPTGKSHGPKRRPDSYFGKAPPCSQFPQRWLNFDADYLTHPELFVRKAPAVRPLPEKVWLNKP